MPKVVDHDARKRDFIKAAYQTIVEDGLNNATVRAIAQRAGYTTGALVHYFGDKEDLIAQTLEENAKDVRRRMEHVQSTSQGHAALRGLILEAVPIDKQRGSNWPVWLAMWFRSETSRSMRKEEQKRYKEWFGRIESALQQAQDMGELSGALSVKSESRTIVALIDGLGVQYLMSNGRLSGTVLTEIIDNHLHRLFDNR